MKTKKNLAFTVSDAAKVADAELNMDADDPGVKQPFLPNMESHASYPSRFTQSWLNGLIYKGWKSGQLDMEDLYSIDQCQESENLANKFESELEKRAGAKDSVLKAFIHVNRFFPVYGIARIVSDNCMSMTSLVMKYLLLAIQSAQNGQDIGPEYIVYMYPLAYLLLTITASLFATSISQYSSKVAVASKGMLVTSVYRKALRLNGVGRTQFSSGQILSLVSTDITRIEQTMNQFQMIWTAPIYFAVTIGLLISIIGLPGLAGVGFIFACLPLQGLMIRRLMSLRSSVAKTSDKRLRLSSEILQGIRIIKYFSWETQFINNIQTIRNVDELPLVKNAAFIRSIISSFGFAIPAIAASITFIVYGGMNDSLSSVQIFSTLALFNQLRSHIMWLPLHISAMGDAFISFKRLQDLFDAPEVTFHPEIDPLAEYGVEIKSATFSWESGDATTAICTPATLRNVSIQCPKNGLTTIVGSVGSGKSSLLGSLISELKCEAGSVVLKGTVGYCPQQSWIMNASVKENILFGKKYDSAKYERVVAACCLSHDFGILPHGDLSEIGEKGINLSGGQRQRISLARCMYADTDIALLDDPLSAVDAHVGRTIFEKGIKGLLSSKTRIFVTHQLHYVQHSDWVVHMKDGQVLQQGTYLELMQSGREFAQLMAAYGGVSSGVEEESTVSKPDAITIAAVNAIEQLSPKKEIKALMTEELKQTGSVKISVIMSYFKSTGSYWFLATTVMALSMTQASRLSTDLWLVNWTNLSYPNLSRSTYLGVYAGLSVFQSMSLLVYSLLFTSGGIRASKVLHQNVFARIIRSPVVFFDTTPIGRIMNRLSRDVDSADNVIYDSLRLLFYACLQIISTFVLVAYVTKGLFLVALVPLMGLYFGIQVYYRATSRELKRIESISRSPLYAHISECMSGLSTIRAYNDQSRCITKIHKLMDANASPLYLLMVGTRWIQLRLDLVGIMLVFSVAIYAAGRRYFVDASEIGLALSYLMHTISLIVTAINQLVDVEVQLNSIERLVEYLGISIEDQGGDEKSGQTWPSNGSIKFQGVKMRYQSHLPLVLKGVDFEIRGGDKIGVIGRTGSGKSSLMQALFRIMDLTEGRILIDGTDISTLNISTLRSNLAIIPQDPILFSGTLRKNLDPWNKYTDEQIWSVLEKCGMKDVISQMDGKLDCILTENAENISVGQRQLLCLSRACLQRPKILVLDECTASVDMETDALLQKTIQEEFKESTTLTIAHRLNTIVHSTKILVLNDGVVQEFDTPYKLLVENRESEFSRFVDETGVANATMLRDAVSLRHQ
ncbi:UNVERIFIED_CONTAM: hypothetical protein HDU68_011823 [Siphonaria sp. JEL0065]|nr:hypothetical protein HDU68_011823 [Siphonaria sp. JEL0065]